MIPGFRKLNLSNSYSAQEMNRLQDNAARAIDTIARVSILDGVQLESVVLASGDNDVAHGLGRKLRGWVPTRIRGAVTLYDKQDANTAPEKTLTLNASAGVTVDLWVY